MSRAVASNALNQANQLEAANTQQSQQVQGQLNQLIPAYSQILQSPGYTPQQQSAITSATMGSLGGAYDSLTNSANLNAARTWNGAASTDAIDQLARTAGSQAGQLSAQNQTNFANNAQQQQQQALSGLSNLYGVNSQALSKNLGLPDEYLNTSNTASQNTLLNSILSALTGGLAGGIGKGLGTVIGNKG